MRKERGKKPEDHQENRKQEGILIPKEKPQMATQLLPTLGCQDTEGQQGCDPAEPWHGAGGGERSP